MFDFYSTWICDKPKKYGLKVSGESLEIQKMRPIFNSLLQFSRKYFKCDELSSEGDGMWFAGFNIVCRWTVIEMEREY